MSQIDIDHLRTWIGKTHVGADATQIREGAALPPLRHWFYFLEGTMESEALLEP